MNFGLGWDAGALDAAAAAASAVLFALAWRAWGRRSAVLWALRAAFLACLLVSILKPTVVLLQGRLEKPKLAVILDRSHWMSTREGTTTRYKDALDWLERRRSAIEERADVSWYLAGDRAEPAAFKELSAAEPDAPQLVLERALAGPLARGRRPAVWLVTDGVGDASEDLEGALAKLGVSVSAIGVGRSSKTRGITVSGLQVPDFVFLHEPFPVQLRWEASGLRGSKVELKLRRGDLVVARAVEDVSRDFEVRATTFNIVPGGLGEENYHLDLVPEGAAAGAARQPFRVEVIRQKLRIMFLCGQPSFEYAYLRELLKSDPNHELVSFVILRNPENFTPVAENELSLIPFPAQEIFVQTLGQFDLFILQDFAFWRFGLPASYLESLKAFVQRGGGLLVIGGDQAFTRGGYKGTPLEDILPVELLSGGQDFEPGLFSAQPLAMDHPLVRLEDEAPAARELWASLAPLDGFNRFQAVRPGAAVLATVPGQKLAGGQPLPLFSTIEAGKGRVMVSGTNSTWRWKLGSGDRWRTSTFYTRFWTRAIQYLAGSLNLKKVQFAPLPERLARPPVNLRLRVFDDRFKPLSGAGLEVRVLWTEPGGSAPKEVPAYESEPGVFQVRLERLKPGPHKVRALARYQGRSIGEDEARFVWAGAQEEFEPMNQALLVRVSSATGGEYAPLAKVPLADWLDRLPPPVKKPEVVRREPVWASSFWLWLMTGLLGAEWTLRRRRGWP